MRGIRRMGNFVGNISATLIHLSMHLIRDVSRYGLLGVATIARAKLTQSQLRLHVRPPGLEHPIALRCRTTDIATYEQIFIHQEYACTMTEPPKVIVDAGANIGLSAIYFANLFPQAWIYAIEPEASNAGLLHYNVETYPRIVVVRAALSAESGMIALHDHGHGHWGFSTAGTGNVSAYVPAVTIEQLMADHQIERIDLLKMDIEGAERDVLNASAGWIDRVGSLVLEVHDWAAPGATNAVRTATAAFDQPQRRGENWFFARNGNLRPR